MTIKQPYKEIHLRVTPEQYAAIEAAIGAGEKSVFLNEAIACKIEGYDKLPTFAGKRGTYTRRK